MSLCQPNRPAPSRLDRRALLSGSIALAATSVAPTVYSQDNIERDALTIVELFTSQGCSSCPPADRLLADLVQRHETERLPVLGLSFHVDYWNHLGWKDPFSSPDWSARQRTYAKIFDDRVYTPQMLVGGTKPFVGSRRRELDFNLARQRKQTPSHSIKLQTLPSNQNKTVAYEVAGERQNMVLNVALVSRRMTSQIMRGENEGRKLSYANVVRQFQSVPLRAATGKLKFQVPEGNAKHGIIAYVQNVQSAEITGAAEA